MRLMRELGTAVVIICITLVLAVPVLFLANRAAQRYLRANPEILMSAAERINENTRAVREAMIPPEKVAVWYDLESKADLLPMWDEFYAAGVAFESYVHYRSRSLEGSYYGMTDHGYRKVADQGPWPPVDETVTVFFFGGSTSFGVGPYWATVASYLQEALNDPPVADRPVRVYNFGRSGYHSNQEQILLHRLISAGHVPDAVIFLDGLNDFCFRDGQPSGWQALARFFNETNEKAQARAAGHGIHTDWTQLRNFLGGLPIAQLLTAILAGPSDDIIPQYTGPKGTAVEPVPPRAELETVMDRYIANMRQVQAVGDAYGFRSFFVWQPIPTYKYDAENHIFYPDRLGCHVGSKYGYPLMAERVAAGLPLRHFIWGADIQDTANENLYIDAFHYTAPFSRTLADFIADAIREPLGERAVAEERP